MGFGGFGAFWITTGGREIELSQTTVASGAATHEDDEQDQQ